MERKTVSRAGAGGAPALLLCLLPLAASCAAPAPPAESGRRLVIVGLDAADERMIDAGIAAGTLPHFARVRREGTTGPLRTHRPILSPILWTTMATGLTPDRHGVLDFVEPGPDGAMVPITSRSRRAPAFWEILGERGVRSAVVGWYATWPAESVNGVVVSDRFAVHPYGPESGDGSRSRTDPAGKTFPASAYDELRDTIVEPEAIGDAELEAAFGAPRVPAGSDRVERRELRAIEAATRTYEQAALRLAATQHPDLI